MRARQTIDTLRTFSDQLAEFAENIRAAIAKMEKGGVDRLDVNYEGERTKALDGLDKWWGDLESLLEDVEPAAPKRKPKK